MRRVIDTLRLFWGRIFSSESVSSDEDSVEFFVFKCEKCGMQLSLPEAIDYGQAAVVVCENCGESWVVYMPSLEVHAVRDFEPIWEFLSQ